MKKRRAEAPAASIPSTASVIEALRRRYPRATHAFLAQVRNATGYARTTTRTADALAMGLWPSRGLLLEGFEVKASRSDWLHELKAHDKADEFFSYCDKWWLAIAHRSIASLEELPPRWGLLVLHGPNVRVLREALPLEPKPLDRILLAAILRAAVDNLLPEDALRIERKLGYDKGWHDAFERNAQDQAAHERLQSEVRDFERLSGLTFSAWDRGVGNRIGVAVQALRDSEHFVTRMQEIARTASWLAEQALKSASNVAAAAQVLSPSAPKED